MIDIYYSLPVEFRRVMTLKNYDVCVYIFVCKIFNRNNFYGLKQTNINVLFWIAVSILNSFHYEKGWDSIFHVSLGCQIAVPDTSAFQTCFLANDIDLSCFGPEGICLPH